MRKYLLLLFALIAGPTLVVSGFHEYQNSKKLQAQGKATAGKVIDYKETVTGKSRTHHYYLTVDYSPENASPLRTRTSVNQETFERAISTGEVKVHYLPSDPAIIQAGEKVETKATSLIVGSLLSIGALGAIVFMIRQFRQRSSVTEVPAPTQILADEELKKAA